MTANELAALLLAENHRVFGFKYFELNDNRIFSNETDFNPLKKRPIYLRNIQYNQPDQQISINTEDVRITNTLCVTVDLPCSGDLVGVEPGEQMNWTCTSLVCYQWQQLLQDEYLPDPVSYSGQGYSAGSDLFSTGGGGPNDNTTTIPSYFDNAIPPFIWTFSGDDGTSFINPDPLIEPDFQFDPSDNYETKYPRFTNMVKNLKTFVIENPEVMNALQRYSGFSKQSILNHLTFGRRPKIKIAEMTGRYGYYNKNSGQHTLYMRASYVRGLEQSFLKSTQRATAFLLAVTILHEYIHLGTSQNNISEGVYDFGFGFERDAFNVIVDNDNAGNTSIRFSKYF